MEQSISANPSLKEYSGKTYLKFIILSAFGIFAFFISFPLPGYQFAILGWQFGAVDASSTMLVTHITNLIRAALWSGNFKAMPAIVWLLGVYCMADLCFFRFNSFWRAARVTMVFSIFKIIGFVLLTFTTIDCYFGVSPAFLSWYFMGMETLGGVSISFFILNKILISFTITIPTAAAFLPFLTDYGLIDFIGVLARRFMRPVFKLPGRAAVIAVSAILGTFSIGHLGASNQYLNGRMTKRECVVVGTSLASVSIGFLLVLAQNTDIMQYWNTYVWTTFFMILAVTIIGVRIYPLSKISDAYCEGVTPDPEKMYRRHIFKYAVKEALDSASAATSFGKNFLNIMKESITVLGTCVTGTAFFGAAGVVLNYYTPIFTWIGYIFWPFMRIAIPAGEAVTASSGAALSFLEVTLPSLLVTAGEWTIRTRYMMAVIPVTAIIFLASWVPCIMATKIPVKFSQLVIIWLERMVLSIIITALFALLLFPAGAV